MKIKKIPISDEDYVEFYAENLRENNYYFKQQKKLIESQMSASSSLFKHMFKKEFEKNARVYLKKIGLIKTVNQKNNVPPHVKIVKS